MRQLFQIKNNKIKIFLYYIRSLFNKKTLIISIRSSKNRVMKKHQPVFPDAIKQYNINTKIGQGSFATVYKAFNRQNRRAYAIKIYPKSNLQTEEDQKLFQREIDAMAYIKHPGIVTLHDLVTDDKNFYMVMDYCAGGELFDFIVKCNKLDEPTAALVFKQICSAVAYCHSFGIAHRDLKPENILIDKFPRVMVADFGLCGYLSDAKLMKTFCGSPCYTAPECLLRREYDGKLSDVWSLGVILFSIVTGEHPWKTENTSAMLQQIVNGKYSFPSFLSDDCKDLISSMLRIHPDERITCEKALKHRWFLLESKSPHTKTMTGKSLLKRALPPIPEVGLEELSSSAKINSSEIFNGIVSPFEDDDDEQNQDEDSFSNKEMPRIAIRSASFANLLQKNGEASIVVPKANKKMAVPGFSLSQARQRSANNLLQGTL